MTRLAVSHDWLVTPRGAERTLSEFCKVFKDLSIYALFCERASLPESILRHPIHVSYLDRIPGRATYYRYLLPLFRSAIQQLYVEDADLLLSISHSVAKAIPHADRVPHVCYCLSPARYIWEPEIYGKALNGSLKGELLAWISEGWKKWDLETNTRVDHFVANSKTIQERILRCYGRDSEVIYPGVDLDYYRRFEKPREDFYLIVSALVAQKRIDLAVEAFNQSGKTLVVVGTGPRDNELRRLAGSNIRFLGWQTDDEIRQLYNTARALIFPGLEDFGLVPVEAQGCGCPVIAYQRGGVTETVLAGETGVFFVEQEPESLNRAVREFENSDFDPARAVANSRRFSQEAFHRNWRAFFQKIGFEYA